MKTILFTDGAARGNPGPGGWGFVMVVIHNNSSTSTENTLAVSPELAELDSRSAALHSRRKQASVLAKSPSVFSESENNISLIQGSASKAHTTNNAMELSAVVFGVKKFISIFSESTSEVGVVQNHKPHLEIRLDSKYVRDGAVSWRHGWSRNGWITKEKNAISNIELWQELHDLLSTAARDGIVIEWNLVRGHRGIMGNEMCDLLATTAADTQSELSISEIPLPKSFSLDELLHVPEKVDPYYIAVVDGRKQTFTTWADCSQWVLGKKARYKKVHSKSEEQQVLRDWNIPFE